MDFSTLAVQAYAELYGPVPLGMTFAVSFSGRFTPYNGQITMRRTPVSTQIEFRLSRTWEETDPELVKGLMQSLLVKLMKRRRVAAARTPAMELYEIFIKKIGNYAPITQADPILVDSFDRINARFFASLIERPNLHWGGRTFRKLGHYNYHTDTIMIAETLRPRMDLVDYVMYHEMLHKKHKFYFKNGRSFHHHHAFKTEEAQYPDAARLEEELSRHVSREKWAARRAKKTAGSETARRGLLDWFLD